MAMVAVSPAANGTRLVRVPVKMNMPALSAWPCAAFRLASQASASRGWPMTLDPRPSLTSSPLTIIVPREADRSIPRQSVTGSPNTAPAFDRVEIDLISGAKAPEPDADSRLSINSKAVHSHSMASATLLLL